MSRVQEEANLLAMRSFYSEKLRHAPPREAERIQAHVAALELSQFMPSRAELFHFLAAAHGRAFSAFARRLGQSPAGFFHFPAGPQSLPVCASAPIVPLAKSGTACSHSSSADEADSIL